MKKVILAAALLTTILYSSCKNNDTPSEPENIIKTPVISYSVVNTLPHDTANFLEGLEFYKGKLLESTGPEGKSKLIEYDPATGKISKQVKLDSIYFGEGITVFRDTVYQMTYKEGVVHVYDVKDFKKIKQLPNNNGEGWGLTHDSTHLIGSNGTNNIYYYEPGTFKLLKTIPINENGTPVLNINELEYINGFIYANQWQYNTILKIDLAKGEVVAKMDLTTLDQQEKALNPNAGYLNGIAYDTANKKFYITGKNWSKIYELRFDF